MSWILSFWRLRHNSTIINKWHFLFACAFSLVSPICFSVVHQLMVIYCWIWYRQSHLIVYLRFERNCVLVNTHLEKMSIKIGRHVDCDILLLRFFLCVSNVEMSMFFMLVREFSFGVEVWSLLKIISSMKKRKNRAFCHTHHGRNLFTCQ